MAGELHVAIEPWGPAPEAVDAAVEEALRRAGDGLRLVSVAPVDDGAEPAEPRRVRATAYDYAAERAVLLDVPLDGEPAPAPSSTVKQPLPSWEEREEALAVIEADPELGPALREGLLVAYRPMPPLIDDELPDGTVQRTITVGLRPAAGKRDAPAHEIVGVRLGPREVVRFEGGAPARSRAGLRVCGLPDAGQRTTTNRAGGARITVTRDGEVLWKLIAVRPAASSGEMGSAVELRSVAYRGKRVLRRAHVPILNVRYDNNACGPYRDWQNEESRFAAQGAAPAPGFRLCPNPATTILESGDDQGNFAGVAVYVDGDEVVLVSELEAGWYRYVSRWRLHADGTIKARFGFGAVSDTCVCERHHHHAYWRLDFDIAGAGDDAVHEFNDPPLPGQASKWHRLDHEIRRKRHPGRQRRWRVRNRATGEGYVLVPGAGDGEADGYGIGDFWALRYRANQIDDRLTATDTRAGLNAFINGESLVGENVVVWYAGHFSHVVGHDHVAGDSHIVGPTLKPVDW